MDNRPGMFSLVQFDGQRFYLTEIILHHVYRKKLDTNVS
jgi:hypothetical protein